MWETWVQSLGQEDPLEKEMATHSSILAWRIPRTEEPGGLHSPQGLKESDTTELLHFHFLLMYTITGPYDTHLFDHQISLKRRKCNLQIDFFLYQLLNYVNKMDYICFPCSHQGLTGKQSINISISTLVFQGDML